MLALALIQGVSLGSGTGAMPEQGQTRVTPLVRVVSAVMPTVVNIGTERVVRVADPFEGFFNEFFGGPVRLYKEAIPLGSGVIVDASGLVLTNNHVVQRASKIQVRLWDRNVCGAEPVAMDAANDLALLQLVQAEGKPLPSLSAIGLAAPDDLMLGETVVAVGNPFGLEHSVAAGVLSAKNRNLEEGEVTLSDILQTDAAINPGNSGGPLINMDGNLIGLNVAIRRGAEGIGFALPLRRIEDVLADWLVPSRFSLGVCGVVPGTKLDGDRMQAVVKLVEPDSPAADSGIRVGDHILKANGQPASRAMDVSRILWRLQPGDKLTLEVAGRDPITVPVARMTPNQLVRRRLGVQLQELTAPLRKALGLPQEVRGLAISDVLPGSDFAGFGVHRGDVVFRIGDVDTEQLETLFDVLKDTRPGMVLPVFLVALQEVNGQLYARRLGMNVTVR